MTLKVCMLNKRNNQINHKTLEVKAWLQQEMEQTPTAPQLAWEQDINTIVLPVSEITEKSHTIQRKIKSSPSLNTFLNEVKNTTLTAQQHTKIAGRGARSSQHSTMPSSCRGQCGHQAMPGGTCLKDTASSTVTTGSSGMEQKQPSNA